MIPLTVFIIHSLFCVVLEALINKLIIYDETQMAVYQVLAGDIEDIHSDYFN